MWYLTKKKLCVITFPLLQCVKQTVTRYGFEAQVLQKYTRNVYNLFWELLYHSTAFRIKTGDTPTEFYVHHYNQSRVFAWSRHEFRVKADEIAGKFECECKLWEHTGKQKKRKIFLRSSCSINRGVYMNALCSFTHWKTFSTEIHTFSEVQNLFVWEVRI